MSRLISRLIKDTEGQDLIEYGLLVGIITIGAIVSINAIGPAVARYFSSLAAQMP